MLAETLNAVNSEKQTNALAKILKKVVYAYLAYINKYEYLVRVKERNVVLQ